MISANCLQMARLNQVNIKLEEDDDEQCEVSINTTQPAKNCGDASGQQSIRVPKHVKKEEKEDGTVKQVQPCTKVKLKKEEAAECTKLEWDGDECDCLECRVEREIKVEFSQNNETNNQQKANNFYVNSVVKKGVPSQSSECKRVKKDEEEEDGELIGQWDEDCDCDQCRRLRLMAIRLKPTNVIENGVKTSDNDDGEETEVDDEGIDNEDVLVGNDANRCLAQPNRNLQCSHCLKSFDRKSKLQIHLRVHTGERPFQCDQCDKRFSVRSSLTRHQRIHQNIKNSNIKNFQCHECDKKYARKDHLGSHLLTHSGERPFECRHCAKSFTELKTRNIHEQAIHLHVKPYRCKQCAHTATQRGHIITHIRVIHFGLPPTIKQQRALNIIDDRDARELVEKV